MWNEKEKSDKRKAPCPDVVKAFNSHMNEVDAYDQLKITYKS